MFIVVKYIKLFEGVNLRPISSIEKLDLKSKEYKKFKDKFIIFKYKDNEIYLGKFINIVLNGYYAKIKHYEKGDDICNIFSHIPIIILHLEDFIILNTYDTIEEVGKNYKIMLDTKKYNL